MKTKIYSLKQTLFYGFCIFALYFHNYRVIFLFPCKQSLQTGNFNQRIICLGFSLLFEYGYLPHFSYVYWTIYVRYKGKDSEMLSYHNQFMIFIIHTGKHTRLRLDLLVGIKKVFMAKRINDEEKADWFGSEHTIGQ